MKKLVCLALSLIITALFLYPAFAVEAEEADIPQIKITTAGGNGVSLKKSDGYIDARIEMSENSGFSLDENMVMKVRGNSTAFDVIDKKSFTIKFEKKKNLFSMGSGKKWALISNVFDPTLARNCIAFSLAQELGIDYTSSFKVVELWLDNSFRGCYLLMEPVGAGKDRVNIDTEGNDGKKDFLIELEKSREEADKTYITSNGIRFALNEPDEPDEDQVSYIQSVMDDTIPTLKSGTKAEIEEKIDVDSFAKFYLLNEFLKPVDFDFSSVYFYYKDAKLYAGPPWDYDLSMGNTDKDLSVTAASAASAEGVFANKNLFKYLVSKDWFKEKVKQLYFEHYPYFRNIGADGGLIDSFYKTYKSAIDRNFAPGVWKVSRYWINVQKIPLSTYEENYDYFVNWCNERVSWLVDYFDIDISAYTEATPDEPETTEPQSTAAKTEPETSESTEPMSNPSETETPNTEPRIIPTEPKTNPQPASVNTDPAKKSAVPSLKVNSVKLKAGKTAVITILNKGNNKVTYKTTNKKVVIVKNGKAAALKKGSAKIIVTVGNTKLNYKVKVTTSPKLSRKSITIKKGKTKLIRIKGKSKFVKNKYKNSKLAKIISKKSAEKIKVRGLKKGKTTLKIYVNGVKLRLKVKIK